jgi:hypothetical protein
VAFETTNPSVGHTKIVLKQCCRLTIRIVHACHCSCPSDWDWAMKLAFHHQATPLHWRVSHTTTFLPRYRAFISLGHKITRKGAHTLLMRTAAEAPLHRSRHDRTMARFVSSSAVRRPPLFASRGSLARWLVSFAGARPLGLRHVQTTVGHAGNSRRSRGRARVMSRMSIRITCIYNIRRVFVYCQNSCVCPTWIEGTRNEACRWDPIVARTITPTCSFSA